MRRSILLGLLVATSSFAAVSNPSAATALLVNDPVVDAEKVTAALKDNVPLTRASAARVVMIRNLKPLLPAVREALGQEKDGDAAREEIRALVIVGNDGDIDVAITAAAKWPASMDTALAIAAARRSGNGAVDLYLQKLRGLRTFPVDEFLSTALWGHSDLGALAGSRFLAVSDSKAWSVLLDTLREAGLAIAPGVMFASLDAPSEEVRNASVWYLARSYAPDPSAIAEVVRQALTQPKQTASNREAFGRELLRRMLGGEKTAGQRWIDWLGSDEADIDVPDDTALLMFMTDHEYAAHRNRCSLKPYECALPEKRTASAIPPQRVAPPVFMLPNALPAGLANEILGATRCRDSWLGSASATVDSSGRVQQLDLSKVNTSGACKLALSAILKLSLATNLGIRSKFRDDDILLVHSGGDALCLDEPHVSNIPGRDLQLANRQVTEPRVIKRIEPVFPATARRTMNRGPRRNVVMTVESIITREGCVRYVRLLTQSPFPDLNGAAVMAVSQWRFSPGMSEGHPVEVMFNLTIDFQVR